MKKLITNISIILLLLISFTAYSSNVGKVIVNNSVIYDSSFEEIKITILYDNNSASSQAKADWGFACLIEGTEKTILFDTGADGDVLLNNIDKLGVDIKKIDLAIISHNHHDHTGGIKSILQRNPDLPVYVTSSFSKDMEEKFGIKKLICLDKPLNICKNVFSTGEMGIKIHEQSLIINTNKGLVVITGCSHQGILNVLSKAKEVYSNDIYLVFGGFHLLRDSKTTVDEIIKEFKKNGVQKCGATHCTGDSQIKQFKEAYKENYIEMGAGKVFYITNNGIEVK